MSLTAKFGIQIDQEGLNYEAIRNIALEGEKLGFDSLWLSDHLFFSNRPYLEGWTVLSSLATETQKLKLGMLVLCNSFRYPSLVAKMTATLDVISKGRLELGIGAGWFEKEALAYGISFPKAATRIKQLKEGVEIIKKMWCEERASFTGKYYKIKDAICNPKPIQKPHPPIWIGGSGEKLLLRVVAELADGCNFSLSPALPSVKDYEHKLDVLKMHCSKIRRNPDEIKKSLSGIVIIGRNEEEAWRSLRNVMKSYSQRKSVKEKILMGIRHPKLALLYLIPVFRSREKPFIITGTSRLCIERLKSYLDLGVTHFFLQFPTSYQGDMESLRLFAEEVIPKLRYNPSDLSRPNHTS
jgi:F420-dependent oxidoreductase-like protein